MMNPGGIRVSPREVEQALADLPGVAELAVTEIAADSGSRFIACFYAGAPLPESTATAFAAERLARYKQPGLGQPARPAPHRDGQDRPPRACGALPERPRRMKPVRLDIFADPVCPWCYVGKANLDRALEAAPDHPFIVQWHPFQLNPDMPREGVAKRQWLEDRFGGAAKVDAVHDRLRSGPRGGAAAQPRCAEAHPQHAGRPPADPLGGGRGAAECCRLRPLPRLLVEGRDIGNPGVLADIAGAAGMDRDATARLLELEADADDIAARDRDARAKGVNSVPTWLIGQHYVVSGAQPSELWAQVIEDLRKAQ